MYQLPLLVRDVRVLNSCGAKRLERIISTLQYSLLHALIIRELIYVQITQ